jgi:hypothetical protein
VPLCASSQQKIRHVHAGDQENQDHRSENGKQRWLDATGDLILQRFCDDPVVKGSATGVPSPLRRRASRHFL